MSTELASAYISLITKMPNAKRDIERELDKVDGDRVGSEIGRDMGSGIDSSMGKFAVGGALAGIFASLTSSITSSLGQLASEALTASDATDKFKGTLNFAGLDTSGIDKLTKSTRQYADETVYELSDIQGITAQLASNSVVDFDKLAEAAGNLNAVAGGNSETFKSVGMALTQTAGQGKLTTENWNQLADAIPGASGRLQEAMLAAGAFEGNFRDAMAAGEISAEEFNASLLALGSEPVAVEAAKSVTTFEGMMGNLQATIVGGLSDAFTLLKPQMGAFVAGFSGMISNAVPIFIAAVQGMSDAFTWLAENGDVVIPVLAGIAGVVLTALAPAIGTAVGATWSWTAALLANPLTWIAVGVGALVGALVWFFTETQLGQEVWTNFTTAVGTAWTWLWETVLQPVFTAIGQIFTWLYENVITPIVAGIVLYVQAWAAIFTWLWTNVLSPTFTAIGNIFSWIYNSIILPIITAIVIYVQIWGAIFTWLWDTIISPVFTAIGGIFTWLYENIVSPVFSGIQSAISTVADWITTTLWPGIQTVLGWLGSGFETMGKTITEVWNNIKAAAVAPINFVINSVYNDGIRKLMNDIVDTLGLDANWKMPHVSEIALASGGVLPGYTPGRDVHDFYSPTGGRLLLSGGEAIMRPEFTAALGRGGIDALNAAARSGGINGVRDALGGGRAYANGGVWDDITGGIAGAASWIGDAVGNVAKIMSDPSGAIDTLIRTPVKALLEGIGGGNFGSMMAEIPLKAIDGIAEWAQKNILPPAPSSGEWIGGNTLERLRPLIAKHGLMITDTYRDPAYNAAVGGSPTSYHMDKENPAVDVAGSYAAMDAFVADVRAVGGWRQILWEVAGHYDHAHIAAQGGVFGDLPTKKFDNGGYLQPGVTTVYNGTGKPEPVFTSAQWAQMEDFANGGSGMPSELVIVDADRQLIGRMQVEADGRIKRDGEHRALEVMRGASRR